MRERGVAESVAQLARGERNREFSAHLVGVSQVRRVQRPRADQFVDQHRDAFAFAARRVVSAHASARQQLGDHTLVHLRVLTQIERCQMKAEQLHRAQQPTQATRGKSFATVLSQGIAYNLQIGGQLPCRRVRRIGADRLTDRRR